MRTILSIRATLLVLIVGAIVATGLSPAWAKEKRQPLEKFRARAFDIDRGRAAHLDIVIYEWTSPEERQALLQTFVDGGSDALYDALNDQNEKGFVKAPRTLGYEMRYAWQFEVEGRRRIVLATDRPLGFLELTRGWRSTDYNVSLVVLEVDPATGEGEGSAVGGAELSIDDKTGRLQIEFAGLHATKLVKVKRTLPKKR